MIYEVRTYDIKPGTLEQVEKAFEVALPARQKYSPLAAFWHTEIGPLNQIIHVWGYDSLEQRESIRAEAVKDPDWPPKLDGNVVNMNSEIWNPAPFMRPMGGDQALGGIYEMRIYTYEPGSIPELIRRWTDALPHREKFSPLAAGMSTEFGGLNRWMHVWPYKDLNDRNRVRGEANQIPEWPARSPGLMRQENKIVAPSSFSPMH